MKLSKINTRKSFFVLPAFFIFFIGQTIAQNQIRRGYDLDFAYLNKHIQKLHSSIARLSRAFKDKKDGNRLRIPVSLGHHDFFSDSEDYVYRNDVFLYYSGDTPKDILFLYEQTHTNSLITELRLIRLSNLTKQPPFDLQITYITWSPDSDERGKGQLVSSLIKFSDKVKPSKVSQTERFSLKDIKKPIERYQILLEYWGTLKKLQRTMEYHIQIKEQKRKDNILRSLKIGRK